MNKNTQNCIIHYDRLYFKDSSGNTFEDVRKCDENKLTLLTLSSYAKILESQKARELIGGKDSHFLQCSSIPKVFSNDLYYHTRCYANFTRIMSDFKKTIQIPTSDSNTRLKRTGITHTDTLGRFPEYCMFCKKAEKRIRKSNKQWKEYPTKLMKKSAEEKIVRVVKIKKMMKNY